MCNPNMVNFNHIDQNNIDFVLKNFIFKTLGYVFDLQNNMCLHLS